MHRIDGPGATVDNRFTDGDPIGGVPATMVTDDWANDVQENICKIIIDAGISLVKGDASQLKAAVAAMITASVSDPLNTTRIDVASAATVNLTASAANTRHINITGSTGITAFTVAAGKCYFVRFNASLVLTNGASLVTQSGANITTQSGDTCILRATAANTVELLCYTPGIPQELGYRQSRVDVTGSRAKGVTYTNSTGRTIKVSINMIQVSTVAADFTVVDSAGSLIVTTINESTSNEIGYISEEIPPGATYTLSGGSSTISKWVELR